MNRGNETRNDEHRGGIAAALSLSMVLLAPAVAGAQDATITGKITLDGTPPAAAVLKMDADAECAKQYTAPVKSEEFVVGPGGSLQGVFVYVKDGLGDKKFPPPTEPSVVDQKGCLYHPRVQGVQVGQPLKFTNSDPTLHNVHGMPKANPQFNFAMPKFVKQKDTTMGAPEVMVAVKCDVHPWMAGFVGVVPHPFWAVTGPDGSFTLKGLPPGEYTVEAWHEKLGPQTAKVTVGAKDAKTQDFKFKAS